MNILVGTTQIKVINSGHAVFPRAPEIVGSYASIHSSPVKAVPPCGTPPERGRAAVCRQRTAPGQEGGRNGLCPTALTSGSSSPRFPPWSHRRSLILQYLFYNSHFIVPHGLKTLYRLVCSLQ